MLRGGLGLLAAVVVLGVSAVGLVWLTLPGHPSMTQLPGLQAAATVMFDADGVPRIRAASEADGARVLGYLHARERMFQMDMTRRAAAGELAEVIGAPGLANDRQMRVLGVRRAAAADLPLLPAETTALLEAYAGGVNAWLAERGRFAGPEYLVLGAPRPWTPLDSVLWGKMMGLYLSGNWRGEMARARLAGQVDPAVLEALWPSGAGGAGRPEARLVPGMGEVLGRLAGVLPRFPAPFTLPESASDAWAVDGRFSGSGAPLLAGDPHLGFAMPGTWYLARIDAGGHVLAGATAPGVPFLVLGRNAHVAWSFTTTGADVQDLFVETPVGADQYLTPDGPRPFAVRQETIRVRGGPDETVVVRETRHGPVISDLVAPGGPVLALAMANLAPGDIAAAGLHALNRADSRAAARQAAERISAPVQNMLVADRQGIALFVTGRVPVRRSGDGTVPARGDDGNQDWTALVGAEALPRYVDPASGRLVNGNERIAPADFPVFLGRDWPGDWRARRIRALLAAAARHTLDSFATMQADDVSLFATDMLPALLRLTPQDAQGRAALDLLRGWDGRMAPGLPQPLIFNAWMRQFRTALLAHAGIAANGGLAGWEMVAPAVLDETSVLCGGPCGPMLRDSLARALDEQSGRHGADMAAWRWGEAHPAVFAHPLLGAIPGLDRLGTRRIASPGDDTTLFRAAMRGGLEAVHGAGFRAVHDLADLEASRFMIAPGQSGHILSGQAWNFLQRWRDGDMITLRADIEPAWQMHLRPP